MAFINKYKEQFERLDPEFCKEEDYEFFGNLAKMSESQYMFYELAMSGANIFLTGKAGTGKSFITRLVMESLRRKKRNVVAVAPTGIAAINVGGQTIHSMFALSIHGMLNFESAKYLKSEKRRLLAAIQTVVIDEVSMLRADILDGMNYTLLKNGCGSLKDKQIIFVGDMKQLKAVVDDNMRSIMLGTYDGVEFTYAKVMEYLNVQTVDLNEPQRQSDMEFIDALNDVRDGIKAPYFRKFIGKEPKGVILAPHNTTVTKYNTEGLNALEGKEFIFNAFIEGNARAEEFNFDSKVTLKDGAKIMYLVNSKNNRLVNGTLGTFRVRTMRSTSEEIYFIEVDGVQFEICPFKAVKKEYVLNEREQKLELVEIGSMTQIPVKLAYAITIHKSQGLTFEEVTVDLSLPCFSEGQQYVALSRVKTPEGLCIIADRLERPDLKK